MLLTYLQNKLLELITATPPQYHPSGNNHAWFAGNQHGIQQTKYMINALKGELNKIPAINHPFIPEMLREASNNMVFDIRQDLIDTLVTVELNINAQR